MIKDSVLGGLDFQVFTQLLEGLERALARGCLDKVVKQDMGPVHPISPGRTSSSIPHGPKSHRAVRALHPRPRQGSLGPAPSPRTRSLVKGSNFLPLASSFCQKERGREDNLTFCYKSLALNKTQPHVAIGQKSTLKRLQLLNPQIISTRSNPT